MNEQHCRICGQVITSALEGNLCVRCLDKKLNYDELYYDTQDMAKRLCKGEEQVRRIARSGKMPPRLRGAGRNLWLKSEIERWLAEGQPVRKLPQTPLQESAYAMCRRKDHSWMGYARYEGDSYRRESRVDDGDNTITVGFVHTCYFCDHQEYYYS